MPDVLSQVFTYAQRRHKVASNPADGKSVPHPSMKYDRSKFHVVAPPQIAQSPGDAYQRGQRGGD